MTSSKVRAQSSEAPLSRRDFLKIGGVAGGGLLIALYVPNARSENARTAAPFQPNVFVRIDPDDTITITVARADMGQGVRTAMPMIVAEELDADWSKVRIVQADAHPSQYGRMMTVGSSSVRGGAWMALRRAGATGREMLLAGAAAAWSVPVSELRAEKSRVRHDASGRSLSYGELAARAAEVPVPSQPRLKDPRTWTILGTRVPQVDTRDKVTGRAKYGMDARTPGMLFATVVHPPVFGSTVKSFDPAPALAVAGVKHVVEVSQGVAVVATNTWAAFRGARALQIAWDNTSFAMNSADIFKAFSDLADQPGVQVKKAGDATAALAGAAKRIQATYEVPYLAHATMEPMNCTADVRPGRVEIWAPTQNPQGTQVDAAQITGVPVEAVTVHMQLLGCGWGRRSRTDFVRDAVEASQKVGAPVQVIWTREEDMQHDFYRPAAHHRFEGALDASGKVVAISARIVAQPIAGGRSAVDGPAVAGIADMNYSVPNVLIEYAKPSIAVPVGYWRSVGPSQNAFILESFIDELAHAAKRDPVELRRELLANDPRMRRVLELAAERSGWGSALPAGRARGIGVCEDTGSFVAEVAEVSIQNGKVRVHKVTAVMDCGHVMHPGIVEAQVSGAIVGGLSAALYGEITIENGRVKQGNFRDYQMLRIDEMPEITVHLVPSEEEPGGAGEPGVPPIAPAVANAIFSLTGQRLRRLPIRLEAAAEVGT
jgi:isoquinoline 1-oxidoreductase subunit beta